MNSLTANGILLNKNPIYCLSSFRYFRKNEKHITRIAGEHILLIVFQGTLRFVENGIPIEINENEYYIQKRGLYQEGAFASNAPKYFYLHFQGDWGSSAPFLPYRGTCLIEPLMPLLEQMTAAERTNAPCVIKNGIFYTILSRLYTMQQKDDASTLVDKLCLRLTDNLLHPPSLAELANEFHYSQNYIIRLFHNATGFTPHTYLQNARLSQAKLLLATTNASAESIALECGFSDYSHFYKLFTHHTGMSPRVFRKSAIDPARTF